MKPIKNIVFDIGNVLVGFDSLRGLKKILPDSEYHSLYLEHFILKEAWQKLDAGLLNISSATESFLADSPAIKNNIIVIRNRESILFCIESNRAGRGIHFFIQTISCPKRLNIISFNFSMN